MCAVGASWLTEDGHLSDPDSAGRGPLWGSLLRARCGATPARHRPPVAGTRCAHVASRTVHGVNIVHVVDGFGPTIGGIERQVDVLSSRQALDLPVTVLTAQRRPTGDTAHRRVLHLGRTDRSGTVAVLERLRPDVVHAHVSVVSPLATAVARAAQLQGIPTVLTVHSMWDRLRLPGGVWGRLARPGAGVSWTAVSEAAARHVRRVLPAVDVTVLPNVVETSSWAVARTITPVGDRPLRLVTVGRLARIKQVDRLVDALAASGAAREPHRITLDVLGDGPRRADLARAVHRAGLDGVVRLWGAATQEQVWEALAAADVFVAPAAREAFGIAAVEARASGLPVIGLAGSGLMDSVDDGVDGRLLTDHAALTRWLAAVRADPDGELFALRHHAAHHPGRHDPARGHDQARVLYRSLMRTGRAAGGVGPARRTTAVA